MSLRFRILTILLLIFVAFAGIDLWIESHIISPSFTQLEREMAVDNIDRCVVAVQREIINLDRFIYDWAVWDDMYAFASDGNKEFITANLTPNVFESAKIDLIYIYNRKGKVVWGQARKHDKKDHLISLPDFPAEGPTQHTQLITMRDTPKPIKGVILTEHGAMLVAACPILTTQETGPSHGTVVVGRLVDDELTKTISEQTKVNVMMWSIQKRNIPRDDETYLARTQARQGTLITPGKVPQTLAVYSVIRTLSGKPAIFLRAIVPCKITAKGEETTRYSLYSFLVLGSVVLVVMLILLQGIIISPVMKFTKHAVEIGGSNDLSRRLPVHRHDEIGRLAIEFNSMLEKLADTRRRLLDQSYSSGMSDLAAGVLHNVRNALSPLIVLAADLNTTLAKLSRQQVNAAIGELQKDDVPEQRRMALLRYIQLAVKQTDEICGKAMSEVALMTRQASHIDEIITDQEHHNRIEHVVENVNVIDLTREAFSLMSSGHQSSLKLDLDASLDALEPVRLSRIALLQVMANLYTNAVEAGRTVGKQLTTLHIDAICEQDGAKRDIHLRFVDDGPGIAGEVLPHIFERGFTTKVNRKLTGLGLHWSANTMIAMGGRLYAENDRYGSGACFHLIISST